jgi:mannose-6-phosphate isomerase-like protein (cupin superfamily)
MVMERRIKHTILEEEFFTEERCHILELLNESDDRSQSLARARVEAGVTTAWHRLKGTSEVYYVISGEGQVELGEDFIRTVAKNDVVRIPADMPQRITNTGTEDLIFLCFCMPAFEDGCYEELE